MTAPRLLDLFSCGGGAAIGYARAGFHVTGVDIDQRVADHYHGDEFILGDAMELDPGWIADRFDVVHASPPCQLYSVTSALHPDADHPDLVEPTRDLLVAAGLPAIIENVVGAPVASDVVLCGSMFGLQVRRHRLFELVGDAHPGLIPGPPGCNHRWEKGAPYTVAGHVDGNASYAMEAWLASDRTGPRPRRELKPANRDMAADVMGMPRGLPTFCYSEAIPPAYTEWLATHILHPAIGTTP